MYEDPFFWRGKARHFRDLAETSDSEVLAEALRSRADELDALASRIEAGGETVRGRRGPSEIEPERRTRRE